MLASVLMILTAVEQVSGTGMDRNSVYDQFVCRIWMSRCLLWSLYVSSTYSILALAVDRYVAVLYPIIYKVMLFLKSAVPLNKLSLF
jgi:hypothetical protein